MKDPVIWMDGYTYERREIEGWLSKHQFNTTRSDLAYRNILFPNRAAKAGIEAFLVENANRSGAGKRRIENEDPGEIPEYFVCPLSQRIMRNPVICADGVTYEKVEIERWLVVCNKSPTTNEPLQNKTLTPNDRLKAEIDAFAWQNYVRKIHLIYFQIFVETPAGPTVTLDVRKTSTVADIKHELQRRAVGRMEHQQLSFQGRQVENESTLSECHIERGSTLVLGLIEPAPEPMDSDSDEDMLVAVAVTR